MKKHNLLKVACIAILVTVLLTWILPTTYYSYGIVSDGSRSQVGIFDLLSYPSVAISYFGNIAIYILAIGGFYGILHKIGSYRTLLDKIVKKVKGKECIILAVIMFLMAALTSVCGVSLGILFIVPFLVSLVLLMGYDKMTAAMVTIGSIAVGLIGTTLSSTYIAGSYNIIAQNGSGVVNSLLSTTAMDQIIAKVAILVLGLAILIFNTLRYAKKNKASKKQDAEELVPTVVEKNAKIWPIVVVIDLIFLVTMLALTSWTTVFKLDWFTKATEAVMNFKIGDFAIFSKILGTVGSFEQWSVNEVTVLLLLATMILAIVYKVKLNEYFENMASGIKKALKPALLTVLIYVILVIAAYHPITLTILKPLLTLTKGLNVFTMSLVAFISSLFNVDMYYAASGTIPYIIEIITDSGVYSIIALIWQAMYGFACLFAPTSIILMVILSYLGIPYGKWIKENWKFLIEILVLCLIVFTILIILV